MKIKRIIDISRKIHPGIAVWPGDPNFSIEKELDMEKGSACNVSSIGMCVHTGTHMDAPRHFIQDGKDTAEVDLSSYIGFTRVFELKVDECISETDLRDLEINEGDIVFFKTKNSDMEETGEFSTSYIHLDLSAAEFLIRKKVKTIGVDYLSIGGFNNMGAEVHRKVLEKGLGVIEGLRLKQVSQGTYFFSCLPLFIENADGSPVRAVLIEFDGQQ